MAFNSMSSDEEILIENVRNGERASFDALVKLYRQKGFNIAYGMIGNLEDVKDVLQEAFIKVYLNINSFQGQAKFSTWFYRIVINCSLDFLRRHKSRNKVFTQIMVDDEGKDLGEPVDNRFHPGKVSLNNELAVMLDDCIDSLPGQQKACFVLKHKNGLRVREISEILKCSESTVKVHLFRAVRTLQYKLEPYLIK